MQDMTISEPYPIPLATWELCCQLSLNWSGFIPLPWMLVRGFPCSQRPRINAYSIFANKWMVINHAILRQWRAQSGAQLRINSGTSCRDECNLEFFLKFSSIVNPFTTSFTWLLHDKITNFTRPCLSKRTVISFITWNHWLWIFTACVHFQIFISESYLIQILKLLKRKIHTPVFCNRTAIMNDFPQISFPSPVSAKHIWITLLRRGYFCFFWQAKLSSRRKTTGGIRAEFGRVRVESGFGRALPSACYLLGQQKKRKKASAEESVSG